MPCSAARVKLEKQLVKNYFVREDTQRMARVGEERRGEGYKA